MVITMSLKHVIPRGKTYYFRMRVPQDCTEKIGKKEIVQSLKTTDRLEAAVAAKKLHEVWTAKFKSARTRVLPVSSPYELQEKKSLFRQKSTGRARVLMTRSCIKRGI